jgi:hypothetical protein
MTAFHVVGPTTLLASGGSVLVIPPDTVDVVPPNGATHRLSNLDLGDQVEAFVDDAACILVGLHARGVVVAITDPIDILEWGSLERLNLSGRYDPGGLYRVEFHPLSGDSSLIEYEFGVARLAWRSGLLWQFVHNYLTARVDSVTEHSILIRSEATQYRLSLEDGLPI